MVHCRVCVDINQCPCTSHSTSMDCPRGQGTSIGKLMVNTIIVVRSACVTWTILVWSSQERAKVMWSALLGLKSTVLGFLLPLIVLLLCYCSLVHFLSRHFCLGPHANHQRKLLHIVITLVLAFFLCWLPFHANITLSDSVELEILPYSCSFDCWLVAVHPYAISLAYMNSCLNPLLYVCCDPAFCQQCKHEVKLVWPRPEGERDDAEVRETGTRDDLEEDTIQRDAGHRSKTQNFNCSM